MHLLKDNQESSKLPHMERSISINQNQTSRDPKLLQVAIAFTVRQAIDLIEILHVLVIADSKVHAYTCPEVRSLYSDRKV